MNMLLTVKSPANIALVKYWGLKTPDSMLAYNSSISFNLSDCNCVATFFESAKKDIYLINGKRSVDAENYIGRVRDFLNRRGTKIPFLKVESLMNFPISAGIASSAAGYSAAGLGLYEIALRHGIRKDKNMLKKIVSMGGSLSALRSLGDYFVILNCADNLWSSYKFDIDIVDVVICFSGRKKKMSSYNAHLAADSSFFFDERLSKIQSRIDNVINSLSVHDHARLYESIETESLSFLINGWTMKDPLQYLLMLSLEVVYKLKDSEIEFGFTFDAGSTLHVITRNANSEKVLEIANGFSPEYMSVNRPCKGAQIL